MAIRLDGAGTAKLETLDHALSQLQRLHAVVERMASAARLQQNLDPFKQQVQRASAPLVGMLKGRFDAIADQVSQMILVTSRSGGDQARVRALREYVGQIRSQIESAAVRVREVHTSDDATIAD